MTERELIDALCDVRPEWDVRRAQIHADAIYYVDGARLGNELARAVFDGHYEPWMHAAFDVIERALVEGTPATRNLLVVGLFEAMQGTAYREASPADCLDAWFGPRSQQSWADLIEGWTGDGIRSIATWRRVVINGPRTLIALEHPDFAFHATLDKPHVAWRRGAATGTWTPTPTELADIHAPVKPLVAERIVEVPIGDVVASLEVDGAQGHERVLFGDRVEGGHLAICGKRSFVIDLERLANRWRWLSAR